jgi:hypothetical protein
METRPLNQKRITQALLPIIPVLLPLFILVGSGIRGLDYGIHMDEGPWQIGPVKTMLRSAILLPQYYAYPSFDYWVIGGALIPDIFAAWPDKARVVEAVESHAYLLRVRAVFLVITSLSVLWVYLAVLHWRQSWVEALLASAFLAFSWEVAYHLRWIASDGMLMQFGALTLLCTLRSWLKGDKRSWLQLAAVAAGLGCGSKYPGGLLLVPVLVAGYLTWDGKSYRTVIWLFAQVVIIFAGVYLVTTPGTVLQPMEFRNDVLSELAVYSSGSAGALTIAPGFEHAWLMFIYFSSILFSHYVPIAVLGFALCIIGGYALVMESRKTAALFLCFPVLYLLYFSMQRIMLVRNLLVVTPFFAILAARGAVSVWEYLKFSRGAVTLGLELNLFRACFALLIIASLVVNGAWLLYAAETIVARHTDRFAREAAAYVAAERAERFFLSPRVRLHLGRLGFVEFPNVVDDPNHAQQVVFYASEAVKSWMDWPGNRLPLIKTWFGPYEVNFDMYRAWTWRGDDRIIVMPIAEAKDIGLLVTGDRQTTHPSDAEGAPCTLSIAEAQTIMGPLREEPKLGGVVGGATACTYIGTGPIIVNIGTIHLRAFEAPKYNAGVKTIAGLGDEAYTLEPDAFNDLFLFVRSNATGVVPDNTTGVVRNSNAAGVVVNVVTGAGGDWDKEKHRIAQDFAKKALDRLIRESNLPRTFVKPQERFPAKG